MTTTTSRVQTLGGPALFVLLWSTGFVGANPILARLTYKSTLETTYMKGKLRAFYRIADISKLGG